MKRAVSSTDMRRRDKLQYIVHSTYCIGHIVFCNLTKKCFIQFPKYCLVISPKYSWLSSTVERLYCVLTVSKFIVYPNVYYPIFQSSRDKVVVTV